jgi:hypothetical protein
MDTSNFGVGKDYLTKKYGIPTLAPVNKLVKFEWKAKNTYIFFIFLKKKKGTCVYRIPDSHFTVKIHKSNI